MVSRSAQRLGWLAVATAVVAAEDGVVDPRGRVSLSVDSPTVREGGTVAWTVTATTKRRGPAEPGHVLVVRVVSAGDGAEASYDYRHLDQLVSFEHSDFARDRVPAKRRSVFAGRYRSVGTTFGRGWIARKSGTVTILDDIMVEETETFTVALSIMDGVGWVSDAGEGVEVSIRDTDAWGLELVAGPDEIAEGETSEVELTARILRANGEPPAARTCVVPFPIRVRLATGGSASRGVDYTLTDVPDHWRIPACAPEYTWTVRLTAHRGDEDDADESVRFKPVVDGFQQYGRPTPAFVAPALVTIRERR